MSSLKSLVHRALEKLGKGSKSVLDVDAVVVAYSKDPGVSLPKSELALRDWATAVKNMCFDYERDWKRARRDAERRPPKAVESSVSDAPSQANDDSHSQMSDGAAPSQMMSNSAAPSQMMSDSAAPSQMMSDSAAPSQTNDDDAADADSVSQTNDSPPDDSRDLTSKVEELRVSPQKPPRAVDASWLEEDESSSSEEEQVLESEEHAQVVVESPKLLSHKRPREHKEVSPTKHPEPKKARVPFLSAAQRIEPILSCDRSAFRPFEFLPDKRLVFLPVPAGLCEESDCLKILKAIHKSSENKRVALHARPPVGKTSLGCAVAMSFTRIDQMGHCEIRDDLETEWSPYEFEGFHTAYAVDRRVVVESIVTQPVLPLFRVVE